LIHKPNGGPPRKPAPARGPAVTNRQMQSQSPQAFVRGVVLELKRVTWPTREEWISATILTIVLVVAVGLFTYACDQLFGAIFGKLHL
jgi:preprotein translocase SecE subunit